MAENDDGQEKKHDPSERKWEQAAEEGNLPRSADIGSAAVVLSGAAALAFGAHIVGQPILEVSGTMLSLGGPAEIDVSSAVALMQMGMRAVLLAIALPLGAALVAGVVAGFAQTRGQLATSALTPKPEKLDPIKGFQNLFMSATPAVELVKGAAKLLLLAVVAYFVVGPRVSELPAVAALGPRAVLSLLADLGWTMVLAAIPVLVGVAVIDYSYSLYRMTEQLKLTDKELKDEQKESEGDPHVKAQRRARARQIASANAIIAVRKADVVITNPTHYAVALRYRKGEDAAPIVLAKGVDGLALRMRAEALRNDIPRVEDRPLARALHARVKEGHGIPEDLYVPVAKVLAWVWRRRTPKK